jgi:hypothetical protein
MVVLIDGTPWPRFLQNRPSGIFECGEKLVRQTAAAFDFSCFCRSHDHHAGSSYLSAQSYRLWGREASGRVIENKLTPLHVTNSRAPRRVSYWIGDIMGGSVQSGLEGIELNLKAAPFRAFVLCHFKLQQNAT